jgi:glutathione S-transferase
MKLHTVPGSPNGRKVEAVIYHLGLDVEIQHHDLFSGELRAAPYASINPNSMVPTLVDGGFVLWESTAIMQYLADKAGDESLFPRDARARADITRWQVWEVAHFNKAFGTLAFEVVAKAKHNFGPRDEYLVRQAQDNLARFAPVLDAHLAGREYLVGKTITLADYSMIPFEGYRALLPFDWAPYRNINAYFDRMRTAPAWVRATATATAPAAPAASAQARATQAA